MDSAGALDRAGRRHRAFFVAGRIAFSAGRPEAEDIYVINADGTGLSQVTSDPVADFDPTWSPDGRRIAYRHQQGDDESTEVYVADADANVTNLTMNQDIADLGSVLGSGRTTIAWNSSRETPGRLRGYLMKPNGSGVRQINDDVWMEYPAWSPDGKRLAFMAQTPEGTENYEIHVINADGTGLRRLTDSPAEDGWPAWSPDGHHIVFSSTRDDCSISEAADCKTTGDIGPFHTLYAMDSEGSGHRRLSEVFGMFPDWSPDGKSIVFEGQAAVRVMRADGSGLTQIPTRLGFSAFPDWIA